MTIHKRLLTGTAAALAMIASTSSAHAATVVISNIQALWQNATGASVSYQNQGGSPHTTPSTNPRVAWGTPDSGQNTFNRRSGYDFSAPSSSYTTPDFNAVGGFDSGSFLIGTFTHRNNPLSGNSNTLETIQLVLTADLAINGDPAKTYTFTYDFTHDETTNNLNPCPHSPGSPVNNAGCADLVTFNFNSVSDNFDIDGTLYTLNLAGFLNDGMTPITSFLSKEGGSNSADIVGKITAWKDVVPGGVPEPSTWLMMILGFGFIGGIMRQKQSQSVRYDFA